MEIMDKSGVLREIILQASDMDKMIIKGPATDDNPWGVDMNELKDAFLECLALIRKENPRVVIFNFTYTVVEIHWVILYYSIRGRFEISPMGIREMMYDSLAQFKKQMHYHFSKLDYPT